MARVPAHIIATLPLPHGREAVWAAVRRLKWGFSVRELWQEVNRGQRGGDTALATVRDYLQRLCRAGIMTRGRAEGSQTERYRLLKDMGPDAPRLRKDGSASPPLGITRMWRAMRVLQRFTAADIALSADVPLNTAKSYCRDLKAVGILRMRHTGVGIGPATYRLEDRHYTGPCAPRVTTLRGVWDKNRNEVLIVAHRPAAEAAEEEAR